MLMGHLDIARSRYHINEALTKDIVELNKYCRRWISGAEHWYHVTIVTLNGTLLKRGFDPVFFFFFLSEKLDRSLASKLRCLSQSTAVRTGLTARTQKSAHTPRKCTNNSRHCGVMVILGYLLKLL